jgi:hypothetical protein
MKQVDWLCALRRVRFEAVLCSALLLAACGGSGGVAQPPSPPISAPPKAWQGAAPIDAQTSNALSATDPQIAIDASGNAIAVWEQRDGTRRDAWANRFDASTGKWGVAELIESDDAGSVFDPQIAMAPNGSALAVWEQFDGTRSNAWANRFDASTGKWGGAGLIEANDAVQLSGLQIAMDASGNAVAVWEQTVGDREDAWANRFDASTGQWGTAQRIETNDAGSVFDTQIAMAANGNAMAVWEQDDGANHWSVWANHFDAATGQWAGAVLIETSDISNADYPQVAMDANGNAMAVWEQSDGTRFNIWANRFDAGTGAWGLPQRIGSDTAAEASNAQIALDASGNAVAVWEQRDGTRSNAWVNRFDASTGKWGVAELIETNDASGTFNPQIAMDASGNAMAVWDQDSSVWVNRFDASTGQWGTAELLEADSDDTVDPQIAMNASGNAVAVWRLDPPTSSARDRILANVFK